MFSVSNYDQEEMYDKWTFSSKIAFDNFTNDETSNNSFLLESLPIVIGHNQTDDARIHVQPVQYVEVDKPGFKNDYTWDKLMMDRSYDNNPEGKIPWKAKYSGPT